jgi:hypothetical protein
VATEEFFDRPLALQKTRPRTLPCPQRLLPPGSGRASEPHLPRKRVSSSRAVLRPSTHRM